MNTRKYYMNEEPYISCSGTLPNGQQYQATFAVEDDSTHTLTCLEIDGERATPSEHKKAIADIARRHSVRW